MKLSQHAVSVIKTFSNINSNLLIEEGKILRTISVAKNIVAYAELDEEFPQEFGIYNTNEFLGALSLFKEPDVSFSEKFVTIRDAQNTGVSLKYVGASKDILVYPTKDVKAPEFDVSFEMTQEQLQSILKGANIIGAPDLQVVGSDNGVSLKVCDRKNPSSNDFQIQISDVAPAADFTYNLKIENLKLFPGDYSVQISGKGLSKWSNAKAKVTIYIALESA